MTLQIAKMTSIGCSLTVLLILAIHLDSADSATASVLVRSRQEESSILNSLVSSNSGEDSSDDGMDTDNYVEDVEDEMRDIMKANSGRSNSYVSDRLYEFLAKKYSNKRWFVIVYTATRRLQSNVLTGSPNCHVVFREGHKNAASFSFESGSFFGARGGSGMPLSVSPSQHTSLGWRSEAMACKGYGDECNRSGRFLMALLSSSLESWKRPIRLSGRVTSLESILSSIC